MASKYYYIIVHEKTGKPLVISAMLPMYWLKGVAKHVADLYNGYVVKPVSIEQLESIIDNQQKSK